MGTGDVNKSLLIAVLHIMETWIERDRNALARINGMAGRPDSLWAARGKAAYGVLKQALPTHAHANLMAGIASVGPRARDAVGETALRWASPERRVEVARSLLAAAARAQQAVDSRAETARVAVEREAARLVDEAERLVALERFRVEANTVMQRDFLSADGWFRSWETGGHVTRGDFEDWKAAFAQTWVRKALGDDKFDLEQARAVATTATDLRLMARAGSGKTRTIVTRALFLQLHCHVDAGEILLVAFNRQAVDEIRARLRAKLPSGMRLPHVVTFHALAYALLRPEEELVFDDEDSESLGQSTKVQAVVNDLLLTRADDVRRAMIGHFTDDWERIRKQGLHMSREEFIANRTKVTRVTLGGEYVKSMGERLIANALFEHAVEYKYERNYTHGGFNYRPDFTVLVNGKPRVVIEYFGLDDPDYQQSAYRKRTFWASQVKITFVEFTPKQVVALGEEGFRSAVLAALDRADIPHRRLSEDEIWERVRDRAVDTFSKTLRGFVNRARQLNLSAEDIRQRMCALDDPDDSVVYFLELATDVYHEYVQRSRSEGYEDFSGIMWRAGAEIRDGHTTWVRDGGNERGDLRALRFIHVDEFQDFSEMFMDFIQAVRQQVSNAVLCCVGDDWQAINGFAGADLRFFTNFGTEFPGSTTHQLVTNYRSGHQIVSAGNALMEGFGEPARPSRNEPGNVLVARLADFHPSSPERQMFEGDLGTPALLRLINHALAHATGEVVVLFRRNTVPWFINTGRGAFGRKLEDYLTYLRGHFGPEDAKRIDLTTSHKYKGREAEFVIVADADEAYYPLIHPTAELFGVFGDTVETLAEADRRLLYVATTRAESTLCYLVTTESPSPFLGSVVASATPVRWWDLQVVATATDARVEIRVYDAYEVRDALKHTFGFKFDEDNKVWYVHRPSERFDFQAVRAVLAFIGTRLIEVRDDRGRITHRAGQRAETNRSTRF